MEFPRLVFECPGPHRHATGTYDHKSVSDEESMSKALEDGWFESLPDAIIGPVQSVPVVSSSGQEDNSPPTRAELEAKAKELAIKFDKRTGDKTLGKMIADALEG